MRSLVQRGAPFSDTDSISDRIARRAASAPEHIAVTDGNVHITYAGLERQSSRLAAQLQDAGAGPDRCVGLLLERSALFIVAALAVVKSGAAYVPLDPSTPPDRAAFILRDAGAIAVLTDRRRREDVPAGPWRAIELAAAHAVGRTAFVAPEPDPERLAYVIYTSGSTGEPKGVEITHANLCSLIDWHQSAFAVDASDRASHVAGLGFDAAVWEIWPYLTAGATVHVADDVTRRSAQMLRDWMVANRITIGFVPTVLAEQLIHTAWPARTELRILLTGGDTLHRRPTAGLPFAVVNNYGPTECTVVSTSGTVAPDGDASGPPSIGRPIPGATAWILDDALRPVAPGEAGELCIAGALVGRGYRNRPQLTAASFIPYPSGAEEPLRLYRTGDRVRLLANGELAFLGRADDQVKVRGYRIELGEIAACLDRYPGIDACAVSVDARDGDPALIAYVVPARDAQPTAGDVRAFLATRLPDYMIPAAFVRLSALPMTLNGKLDTSRLPAPSAETLLPGGAVEDASGAAGSVQRAIAEMVASLVGQPSIGADDNFFMIGGHSMLGVQLVARIRDTFGVSVTLRQLFTGPSVSALSAEVARLTKPQEGASPHHGGGHGC